MRCFLVLGLAIISCLLGLAAWLIYTPVTSNQIQLSAFTGLLGVALGFGLNFCKEAYNHKRQRKANLAALNAELEYCGKTACSFLTAKPIVMSPSYRLPTLCFQKVFPLLLPENLFSEDEIYAVIEYFTGVETLNRGLDQANATLGNGDETISNPRLEQEHNRNVLKATRLIPSSKYYGSVKRALDRLAKSDV